MTSMAAAGTLGGERHPVSRLVRQSAATDIAPSRAARQVFGSLPSARDYLPGAETANEKR
jgi:hypothetical protein